MLTISEWERGAKLTRAKTLNFIRTKRAAVEDAIPQSNCYFNEQWTLACRKTQVALIRCSFVECKFNTFVQLKGTPFQQTMSSWNVQPLTIFYTKKYEILSIAQNQTHRPNWIR